MSKEIKGVGGTHGFQDKCTVMELPKLPSSITMLVDMEATLIFLGWFVFQAILAVLPIGRVVEGQPLRSGERLKYRINGKCAFCWLLICFFWGMAFLCPCRKFELPYLGTAQQLQEQHYPFLLVCFICQNNGVAASAWDC